MKGHTREARFVLKDWIALTKPRLLRLNIFAALGGFWVASKWDLDIPLMIWMLIGSTLTMASATVVNNYWDRELDEKMERTKNRVLPTGRMKPLTVLAYGLILGIVGLAVLFTMVNPLTGLLGLLGWFAYIVIYTIWLKRTSTWSTSVGGISGAMPPVIGYCAVTNEVDAGAWLLFLLMFLWQPAHFWSLAIRRVEEYRKAGFPVLPVVKGIKRTKMQMIPYVLLLLPTVVLMYTYHYAGIYFLIIALVFTVVWLIHTLTGLSANNTDKWAKINFLISVNYLMIVFIALIANTLKA
ncbi:heme o synthase [Paenibacillus sp. J5C_2022]|uniref:heme o synthase n=1 Tax=Paenibacillus sp. J5C2022 TaxID=2977129 RepID=UPI0021CE366B|nr:heme o synthase [Paenibacillus sp. J5C2022]MCU6709254.1 heme o synthase [Paenibacillus sp. J5C2022]